MAYVPYLMWCSQREGLQGVDFDWEVPRSKEDQQAYATLLIQASEELHKADLLISVALHPKQFMPQRVYNEVDRINFMAYDLDYNHVAEYDSVIKAVEEFYDSGCPASKMVLGIPAYGRHFQHPALVKTFAELMDESSDAAVSRHVWNGYRYDTPATVHQKVEYAVFKRMAGVFFWELGQDKQHAELGLGGILLEAAATYAKRLYEGNQQTEEL
jgi:GH18 family chitinase